MPLSFTGVAGGHHDILFGAELGDGGPDVGAFVSAGLGVVGADEGREREREG